MEHKRKQKGGLTVQMKTRKKRSRYSKSIVKFNWNCGFLSIDERYRIIQEYLKGGKGGRGRVISEDEERAWWSRVPGCGSSVKECIPAFPDSTTEMFYILNHIHEPEMFPFKEPVKTIWNESIKAVTPTFKTGLDYVKIFLVKEMNHPKVQKLPRKPCSLEDAIRETTNQHELCDDEIMKKLATMNCSQEALCLSHRYKRTKDFHLKWFSYYKKNPKVFQEHYNS